MGIMGIMGIIFMGIMGSGIVKNLLNSGHTVTVWNRTVEKVIVAKTTINQSTNPFDQYTGWPRVSIISTIGR